MDILYLDVYFLINFTTDMLAAYFAARLVKIKTTTARLLISAAIGAVFACLHVLYSFGALVFTLLLLFSLALAAVILARGEGSVRRFKLLIMLLILETLIGGAVSFLYSFLDEVILSYIQGYEGAENRWLLIGAAITLLLICFLRLLLSIFSSSQGENNVTVEICIADSSIRLCALVDSGNLLVDPFDSRPVIIVKSSSISELLLPYGDRRALELADGKLYRRMRIIPATSALGKRELLYGFLPDSIKVISAKKTASIDAVVAIDFSNGDFGGYGALAPGAFGGV